MNKSSQGLFFLQLETPSIPLFQDNKRHTVLTRRLTCVFNHRQHLLRALLHGHERLLPALQRPELLSLLHHPPQQLVLLLHVLQLVQLVASRGQWPSFLRNK